MLNMRPNLQRIMDLDRTAPMFEQGGMIPAAPPPAGLQKQQTPTAHAGMGEINTMAQQNPEVLARIRSGIEAGIQSGELTMEELNVAVQMAQAVAQNPELYPQMRQFAIQKGLGSPEEIPEQYDTGLISTLLIIGRSMQNDVQVNGGNTQVTEPPVQEMEQGGMVQGPTHAQGGVRAKVQGGSDIEVEGGEYVIPRDVVIKKGTEFFDKLIEQTQNPQQPKGGTNA